MHEVVSECRHEIEYVLSKGYCIKRNQKINAFYQTPDKLILAATKSILLLHLILVKDLV